MTEPNVAPAPLPGAQLRERRRRRLAAAIEKTALQLFAERGFTAVTIDDIAAAVDISTRTFFRYFASKEDLLFGDPRHAENVLVEALESQPASDHPVRVLHAGLLTLTRDMEADETSIRLRLQILEQSPDTMAAAFEQRRSYQQRLTPVLARRMGIDERRDMRPALIVNLSMSATYVAAWHWLTTGAKEPLHQLVEAALTDASTGLAALAGLPRPPWPNPRGRTAQTPLPKRSRRP